MRHPIRGNIRVGIPITLEPGPDRISPPKRVSTVYHGPGFAEPPLRRQAQALRRPPSRHTLTQDGGRAGLSEADRM